MQRVASRQRLFSWDHFDAHVPSSNGDDKSDSESISSDCGSDYRTCISSRHGSMIFPSSSFGYLCHDNTTSNTSAGLGLGLPLELPSTYQELCATASPSHASIDDDSNDNDNNDSNHPVEWADAKLSSSALFKNIDVDDGVDDVPSLVSTSSVLFDVNQDVQFHILSFLDLQSLRSINLSCRYFCSVLSDCASINNKNSEQNFDSKSCVRNAIWWDIMRQTWPFLSLDSSQTDITTRSSAHITKLKEENNCTTNMNGRLCQSMVKFVTTHRNEASATTTATTNSLNHTLKSSRSSKKSINYGTLLTQTTQNPPPTLIDPCYYSSSSSTSLATTRMEQRGVAFGIIPGGLDHTRTNEITSRLLSSKRKLFTQYEMNINSCDLNAKSAHISDMDSLYKVQVLQFIGRVGVGDQSIRSDQPFPRPLESLPTFKSLSTTSSTVTTTATTITKTMKEEIAKIVENSRGRKRSHSFETHDYISPRVIFERLRSCHKRGGTIGSVIQSSRPSSSSSNSSSSLRGKHAFVTPTVSKLSIDRHQQQQYHHESLKRFIEIDVTPRFMSYFEVSILPRDETMEPKQINGRETSAFHARRGSNIQNNDVEDDRQGQTRNSSSCVAIGLSTEEYSTFNRMPGWDKHSYGYHGDDGAIFHSNGDMIRVYGPKYSVGDTVGCGVNYQNGGIFFTLNGDFLGYAWCNEKIILDGKANLYPTIGVDSSCPLACNFGNERPFVWDFLKYCDSLTQDS